MPTEKLSMRKIKQILQLHHESGLSWRAISVSVGTSYSSVANYLNRAEKAGISWPLSGDMDERDLQTPIHTYPDTHASYNLVNIHQISLTH